MAKTLNHQKILKTKRILKQKYTVSGGSGLHLEVFRQLAMATQCQRLVW